MRIQTLAGVVLIVIGLIALATGGITYTKREKIVDLGPIEATREQHERIPLPPLLGTLALAGGIVLLVTSRRNR